MDVSTLKRHTDWTKIWAGGWSLLSCSHFGDEYTKEIIFGNRPFLGQSIIFVSKGKSSGWARQEDRDILGKFLSLEVRENPKKMAEICYTLKKEVDLTLAYMNQYLGKNKMISKQVYQDFWNRILLYYKHHINVKYVVDYLEPTILEKYLPQFEEARIYAEPVFKHSEEFVKMVANQISVASGYSPEIVLCVTKNEVYTYFDTGLLPAEKLLKERYESVALLFDKQSSAISIGDEVAEIEKMVTVQIEKDIIKGYSAYQGKVIGVVKIILDPEKASHFQTGDVLVTGMTRPEYIHLMEKSSAIITDAGGILSHAAISARELKKPCVIGTQVATKVLKDGDVVEIDATSGVVKIIK